MEHIALDLLGPLPITHHGNKHTLVVCNYFTCWTEAHALTNKKAATVARALVNEWICCFGVPDAIHSDQGSNLRVTSFSGVARTQLMPGHSAGTLRF